MSSNFPSRIFASKVGLTSIVTLASFTVVRFRYLISLRNFGSISLASTQGVGYDIGLTQMIIYSKTIILDQFQPCSLSQV
jgi:hypothetical protein